MLAAVAGCTSGPSGSTPHPSGQASARPAASSSGSVPACPSTPVAGPAHTLTFPPPASVAGWQYNTDPGVLAGDEEPQLNSQTLCELPTQSASFSDSQGDLVTFQAGHHADVWTTFSSFWGFFFSVGGMTVTMVPAGPLGGQAGCGKDSEGAICAWFDSDTIGELVGSGGLTESQVASLLVAIRDAVEHPG